MNIGVIVEGHGEASAVPLLLRRLVGWVAPELGVPTVQHFRLPKGKMLKEHELRRTVELLARKIGPGAPILVLLDADDDPACAVGPRLLGWARAARGDRPLAVVVAVREFEAWFLAAGRSLAGKRGLPIDLEDDGHAEGCRDPKSWLSALMEQRYAETLDQPALAAAMDLQSARSAKSFDKLVRDVARLVGHDAPLRVSG